MDSKKSPLALLAQTCSSIGKDSNSNVTTTPSNGTTTKSINHSTDKKDGDKSTEKTFSDSAKREGREKESRGSPSKPGFRTVPSAKDIPPPLVPVSSRARDESSYSPSSKPPTPRSKEHPPSLITDKMSSPAVRTNSAHSSSSRHGDDIVKDSDRHKRRSPSPRSPPRHVRDLPFETKLSTSSAGYPPHYGVSSLPYFPQGGLSSAEAVAAAAHYAGLGLPLPAHTPLGSHSAAAAALAAQSQALAYSQAAALKAGYGSSISPFVTYTRVRTPSGATTLVPVCRDPYCSHCQLTEQNAHLAATCNISGCAQCAHEKSLQSLSMGLGASPLSHMISPYPSSGLLSSLSASSMSLPTPFSQHSALSAHAQSNIPSVCNWVTPTGEQCGKRYSNSEELLQHLRSHTTSVDPMSIAAAYDRYGLASSMLPGLHNSFGSSGTISPSSLRRGYPTSISPLSGIVGSSRYHPYKSMMHPSTGLSSSQHPQGVSQYASPYALFGQRLGPAAVP